MHPLITFAIVLAGFATAAQISIRIFKIPYGPINYQQSFIRPGFLDKQPDMAHTAASFRHARIILLSGAVGATLAFALAVAIQVLLEKYGLI